jgi:hypothetical protein
LRRGFKAQAERLAASARAVLGLDECAPLSPYAYAAHLGILVWQPEDLGLDPHDLAQLTVHDPDSWSGVSVRVEDRVGVILNTAHPSTRRTNTLMHEIAHVQLRHAPSHVQMTDDGLLLVSEYPKDLEEEADWLAGALLLPRAALVLHRGRGSAVYEIAGHFGVSDQLCNWRLRMTGVDRQLGVGRGSPFV